MDRHSACCAVFLLTGAGLLTSLGCGGVGSAEVDPDTAAARVSDRDLSTAKRATALERLWADAQGQGDQRLDEAREEMKRVLWRGGAPQALREAALACLFSDDRPSAIQDTANFLRLRLPTEPQYGVLRKMCEGIAERAGNDPAWQTTASGLVRSWSRRLPSPPDDQRPERMALAAIFSDRTVEDGVFAVFLDPAAFGGKPDAGQSDATQAGGPLLGGSPGSAPDSASRIRAAAWDVLGRIDPHGERRTALLRGDRGSVDPNDRLISGLRRASNELGVVPITGSELVWLETLWASKDPRVEAWWTSASSAVARLGTEQRTGLQMRHLEPVRWSAANRPEWLIAGRADLRNELDHRLQGRRIYRVGSSDGTDFYMNRNRPSDWEAELVWGDVLAVLVVDEAIADERVRAALFQQADGDRADTSTEWGGCVFDASIRRSGERAGFEAVVYPSRPAQRINDRTFVAADEMFGPEGALSLSHYHFHVQVVQNNAYAGPGKGDREYADLHNRNCLVFTSIREGVLNADYYQRGGATIDLGEVLRPK